MKWLGTSASDPGVRTVLGGNDMKRAIVGKVRLRMHCQEYIWTVRLSEVEGRRRKMKIRNWFLF